MICNPAALMSSAYCEGLQRGQLRIRLARVGVDHPLRVLRPAAVERAGLPAFEHWSRDL